MKHVTIATWGRESLLEQTSNYGDFPRMMKHFDVPGNEDSKESGPAGAFIDTKMSSSMAHLNGQSRVAVCAYWGMGWGFTQEENIARTNLNYALGVNFYNTHGVLYSLLAGRNEWVPPEVHFYQPYWQTWRSFTDYVSRLSYVLSQGKHQADVALVYPLVHNPCQLAQRLEIRSRPPRKRRPPHSRRQRHCTRIRWTLTLSMKHDWQKARSNRARSSVSGLEFPVIVLPSMTTIRLDTMTRISKFVAAGGTLVVFRQPPTSSAESGRDDPDLLQMWEQLLGDYASRSESIVGAPKRLRWPDNSYSFRCRLISLRRSAGLFVRM